MNLQACAGLIGIPVARTYYRAIQPQFWQTSLQTVHTRTIPSRYNAGPLSTPQFEVLYLAENHMVALFEVQALFGNPLVPGGVVAQPRQSWTVISVNLQLQSVADIADPRTQSQLQTTAQELTGDWRGYMQRSSVHTSVSGPTGIAPTQELGAALYQNQNLEGVRTLSAKLPYYWTLVVFPQQLQAGSHITFINPSGPDHTIDHEGSRDLP
jgi:RES domain-containing protein